MTDQEKLYETLGELLYAVAMADGLVQAEEQEAMKKLLKDHPWAEEISWSFNYEKANASSVEDVYKNAVSFCQHHGPSPLYAEFVEAMNLIAEASDGIDENEDRVIKSFSKDLIAQFQRDFDLKS